MILGLDASTNTVGISILDEKGEIVQLNFLKLSKWKSLHVKGDKLREEFEKIKSQYSITEIYIEEYAQRFSYGRSSASTITKLASWNGICQYISWNVFNVPPESLNVTRARKLVNIPTQSKKKAGKDVKQQVFEWVTDHLQYQWPTKVLQSGPRKGTEVILDESYDMCDAWVISKAGLLYS
tara:strand:+ start:1449 stop:1991 length:543 start_codon:yes stop_codon:yes gene_type:complete